MFYGIEDLSCVEDAGQRAYFLVKYGFVYMHYLNSIFIKDIARIFLILQ